MENKNKRIQEVSYQLESEIKNYFVTMEVDEEEVEVLVNTQYDNQQQAQDYVSHKFITGHDKLSTEQKVMIEQYLQELEFLEDEEEAEE